MNAQIIDKPPRIAHRRPPFERSVDTVSSTFDHAVMIAVERARESQTRQLVSRSSYALDEFGPWWRVQAVR